MQVLLNTDPHVDGSQQMADHLESVVKESLSRFADHLTRVEAHLADVTNGHASTLPNEIHCTMEARLNGMEPVVVKEQAATAHQAISGAVGKLKRAVDTVLAKQQGKHRSAASLAVEPDELDAPSA